MSTSVANLLITVASATSPSPLVNDSSPDVVSGEEFTKRFDEALNSESLATAPRGSRPVPPSVSPGPVKHPVKHPLAAVLQQFHSVQNVLANLNVEGLLVLHVVSICGYSDLGFVRALPVLNCQLIPV